MEEWTVWYVDTFDREAPPHVDARGRGLVEGLKQLWVRHVFETVLPDGRHSFSRFHLRWRHGRVDIAGDTAGAQRLRGWLMGSRESISNGPREEADALLLERLAIAHAHLIVRGLTPDCILSMAKEAADRTDFEHRLEDIDER